MKRITWLVAGCFCLLSVPFSVGQQPDKVKARQGVTQQKNDKARAAECDRLSVEECAAWRAIRADKKEADLALGYDPCQGVPFDYYRIVQAMDAGWEATAKLPEVSEEQGYLVMLDNLSECFRAARNPFLAEKLFAAHRVSTVLMSARHRFVEEERSERAYQMINQANDDLKAGQDKYNKLLDAREASDNKLFDKWEASQDRLFDYIHRSRWEAPPRPLPQREPLNCTARTINLGSGISRTQTTCY